LLNNFQGVDSSLRTEVWKFLLDYYSWDSSHVGRAEQRKKKVYVFLPEEFSASCFNNYVWNSLFSDDYFRMKLQWKSITPDQEKRFAAIRDRKCLIGL
jgi:hypothetical protein